MKYPIHNIELNNKVRKASEKQSDRITLLVFLVWPFMGAILSFFRIHRKTSLYIIGMFCLLFGLTFNPVNDQLDSFRYAQEFYQFMMNPQMNFHSALSDFFNGNIKDIYASACYYLTYLLSGDIHVLFFFIAITFVVFQVKSIRIIIQQPTFTNKALFLILAFLVIYSNSIFNINGFRFWTAAWIGVYATFKILVEDKTRYAFLLLLTPLVHGAFWIFIGFVVISYFIKLETKPLLIALFASFFFTELVLNNLGFIDKSILPAYMQNLLFSYTESSTAMGKIAGENIEGQPLYWKILTNLPRYYELFLVAVLAIRSKYFSAKSVRIVQFLLLYLIITNVFSAIPSFVRFYFPMVPILAYIWIRESHNLWGQRKLVYAVPFVILYGTFQLVRYILTVSDLVLFAPVSVVGVILKGVV